jgi:hypothetical protein
MTGFPHKFENSSVNYIKKLTKIGFNNDIAKCLQFDRAQFGGSYLNNIIKHFQTDFDWIWALSHLSRDVGGLCTCPTLANVQVNERSILY